MPIFEAVRGATRDDIWSRGVQLARDERVLGVSEEQDEFVLSVVPQGRARPATVTSVQTQEGPQPSLA